jgi:molecular chaperone GrpE (heat shock protein)
MSLDRKILSEIERYRQINQYIIEQAGVTPEEDLGAIAPPPEGVEGAPAPSTPPAPPPPPGEEAGASTEPTGEPQPIDVKSDPEVEKIDDEGNSEESDDEGEGTEELEITDLVNSQKNIEKKQSEYFDNLFGQLSNLENKLKEMDGLMSKLNSLEMKIEKYREKTPEEKLELRTYDSYPFNQKLSDFFDDKKEEMEATGKNDYVLTTDQVKDINIADIKNSFQPGGDLDNFGGKFK